MNIHEMKARFERDMEEYDRVIKWRTRHFPRGERKEDIRQAAWGLAWVMFRRLWLIGRQEDYPAAVIAAYAVRGAFYGRDALNRSGRGRKDRQAGGRPCKRRALAPVFGPPALAALGALMLNEFADTLPDHLRARLALLLQGRSNREAGRMLAITSATSHVQMTQLRQLWEAFE